MAKLLKDILIEVFDENTVKIRKADVIESVAQYGIVGRQLYDNNIMELAERLAKIAEDAQSHILSETDEWFDKISINRNMKSLNNMVKEFKKTSVEHNALGQRLTALYEDMGSVLNRYYDIKETHQNGEHEPMSGGAEEYEKFFNGALEKYGVSSPNELKGDKKTDFFNYIDKNWTGKKETD